MSLMSDALLTECDELVTNFSTKENVNRWQSVQANQIAKSNFLEDLQEESFVQVENKMVANSIDPNESPMLPEEMQGIEFEDFIEETCSAGPKTPNQSVTTDFDIFQYDLSIDQETNESVDKECWLLPP